MKKLDHAVKLCNKIDDYITHRNYCQYVKITITASEISRERYET